MKILSVFVFCLVAVQGTLAQVTSSFQMESEFLFPQYGSGCSYAGSVNETSQPWGLDLKLDLVNVSGVLYAEFDGAPFASLFCKAERGGFPIRVQVPLNQGAVMYDIEDEPFAARRSLKLSFQLQKKDGQLHIQSYCTWDHWCGKNGFVIHHGNAKY